VLAATLPRGRTPPVLPDYLDLSVGGTLVVGGVGSRTWRQGTVSDTVVELRVVTGRGEQVSCSPTRNPRLFDAVRAGLGQVRSSPGRRSRSSRRPGGSGGSGGSCCTTPTWRRCWPTSVG